MRSMWAIVVFLLSLLVACGPEETSTDGDSTECAVGEGCPCVDDSDCPDQALERCVVPPGICVQRTEDDAGGDADPNGSGDAPDAAGDTGPDVIIDDTGAEVIPPGDGQDGVFREDPDLAVQPDEGQDSVLRGDNWGDFVPEGDGDGGGDDLPDRIPSGDGEEEDFGELIEDGGETGGADLPPSEVGGPGDGGDELDFIPEADIGSSDGGDEFIPPPDAIDTGAPPEHYEDLCLDEEDRTAIEADSGVTIIDIAATCAEECLESCGDGCDRAECTQWCMIGTSGLTGECSWCFTQQMQCAEHFCVAACESGSDDCACVEDDDPGCATCMRSMCLDLLPPCLGYPPDGGERDPAFVQMLNLSPDDRDLSIYLGDGDTALASGIAFRTNTGLLPIRPGEDGFAVRLTTAEPDSEPLLAVSPGVSYGSGAQMVVGVIGELVGEGPGLMSVFIEEDLSIPPEGFRWRLFNASTLHANIDVWDETNPAAPGIIADDLAFGESLPDRSREATAFFIGIDVDDDGASDHVYEVGPFSVNTMATFWFANDSDGNAFLSATLSDGIVQTYTSGS